MIILDQYSQKDASAATVTLDHSVHSADSILVVLVFSASVVTAPTVTYNGDTFTQITNLGDATDNIGFSAFILTVPPVGTYPLVVSNASATYLQVNAFSLLGVDKRTSNVIFAAASGAAATTSSVTIQSSAANSLMLNLMWTNTASPTPAAGQTAYMTLSESARFVSGYMKYVQPGVFLDLYNLSASVTHGQLSIVLEPDDAPSIWYPNIQSRNQMDIINTNGLNSGVLTSPINNTYGYKPTEYWQNSFLHTVGRVLSPLQSFSLVAETELQSSQILIDKITQQATASASSLTSDHNVTSQDAVLLIFASQMGISQAINAVNLNGVALTPLGNPSVSTLTAGAYFVVNPNVGVNTVSVSVGLPTALELVVISLLGVDKKTVSPVLVANSGLTGSPSTTIQVAASNSLLIDYVGSLGTSISENSAQTVYFDQPQAASEAAGSIKLSTIGQQTMSWTTLSTAWTQLVVALEPAQAPSLWFPNIDLRNLSDVINVNALDDSINPVGTFYQTYGTHPSTFYQNSFLHTVGRMPHAVVQTTQQPLELALLGVG